MADDKDLGSLEPGDLCHHGSNLLPTYRVIWVDEGKAWLRDVNTGQDAVVTIGQCHRIGADLVQAEEPSVQPSGVTWPDGTPRP